MIKFLLSFQNQFSKIYITEKSIFFLKWVYLCIDKHYILIKVYALQY